MVVKQTLRENPTKDSWYIVHGDFPRTYWSIVGGWVQDLVIATKFDWSSTSDFVLPDNGTWKRGKDVSE